VNSSITPEYASKLYAQLVQLRKSVLADGLTMYHAWEKEIERSSFRFSAMNLAFYLSIRCHDLRKLQKELLPLGLSSLGRSEARTMPNLDAVMASLGRICGKEEAELIPYPSGRRFFQGDSLLRRNANLLFGNRPLGQYTKIMVTMPTEAADDPQLAYDLIRAGMNVVRINCAHDDVNVWEKILYNVHSAEKRLRRHCRIYMDIGGPKIRVSQVLLSGEANKVFIGDTIFLVSGKISNYPKDFEGNVVIASSIPEVFKTLRVGDSVIIDDGKLQCEVTEIVKQGAYLEVIATRAKGFNLKNRRSINFPNTPVDLSPLTEKDLEDLDFIMENADCVGYSFVRNREDVQLLQSELRKRNEEKARRMAIIAKIETQDSVHNLPEIIVQAASHNPFGVMIARGDLAVEAGYRRLAELQEEIMWICEAAHVPVIWATHVLENLVKTGIPSRAEITDAAMSERAECVMLNKGPYIVKAVSGLVDILNRMTRHQFKKTPQLEVLHLAKDTLNKYKR
jgi:pyruvate kinase